MMTDPNNYPHVSPYFYPNIEAGRLMVGEDVQAFISEHFIDSPLMARQDEYTRRANQSFPDLLGEGGKRVRGILCIIGYDLYDGTDPGIVGRAAAILEAYHAYMLVVDDIMDKSVLRHGQDTAHEALEKFHLSRIDPDHPDPLAQARSAAHWGKSAATNAALIGMHRASADLSLLDPTGQASFITHKRLAETGIGQQRDVSPQGYDATTSDDALETVRLKTARYTFLLPLQLGAVLAGAPPEDLDDHTGPIAIIADSAGIAFQLQDDLIGTFKTGDTGKSEMDDIMEGKRTWLVARTLELLQEQQKEKQKRILLSALGNCALPEKVFRTCQHIIKDSGAYDESQELVSTYMWSALDALDNGPAQWRKHPGVQQFLRDIIIFSATRDH
jgi:geranylgeranyl diphosphate synthase type I